MTEFSKSIRMKLPFFIPPPDSRSESEIEADINDEIAFHLHQSAREFLEAGESEQAALALAKERFGNIDRYKRQLKHIALKERIMLQRINLALMIIVILIVGAVSLQVFTTQRYNTLALQAITTELANMKATVQTAATTGHVTVEGDLKNPGRYAFSLEDNETQADLLRKIGVDRNKFLRDGGMISSVSSILESKNGALLLKDGDQYWITDHGPQPSQVFQKASLVDKLPGKWQQIDEKEKVIKDGIVLNISDPNDFMNLNRSTYCKIDHPAILAAVHAWLGEDSSFDPARVLLYFGHNSRGGYDGNSDGMAIYTEEDLSGRQTKQMGVSGDGRWKIKEDGLLYLNLGVISPQPGKPLIFEKVE